MSHEIILHISRLQQYPNYNVTGTQKSGYPSDHCEIVKRKILWMSPVYVEFQLSLWEAVHGNQGWWCMCIPCHAATAIALAPTLRYSFFPLLCVLNDILIAVSSGPPFISRHLHNDIFSSALWLYAQLLHVTCNILHFPYSDLRDVLFLKPHYCQIVWN